MKDSKGFISIFLVIILLSFVVLTSLIVEGAHTNTALIQGERMTSLAMRSILAEYNAHLQKEYGLFAIDGNSGLENKAKSYIGRMLQSKDPTLGKHDNLYQFSIERVTSDLDDYSLLNQTLYKEQILESMKYDLIETELEKLDEISGLITDISSMLKIVNQFQELVVLIREVENQINNLHQYCDGWYMDQSGRKISYSLDIKSFPIEINQLKELHERYLQDTHNLISYRCGLNILENIKNQLVLELNNENISEDFYIAQCDEVNKRIKNYTDDIERINTEEYIELFESRIHSCDKALKAIDEMKGLVHRVKSVLDSIHSLTLEMEVAADFMGEEINEAISDFVKVLEACSEERLNKLEQIIKENKMALEDVRKEMIKEEDTKNLIQWSKQYPVQNLRHGLYIDSILQKVDEKIKNDEAYSHKIKQYSEKINNLTGKYNASFLIDFLKMIYGEEAGQENHEDQFSLNNLNEDNEKREKTVMSGDSRRVLRNSLIIKGLPSQALERDAFQIIKMLIHMKNISGADIRDEVVVNAYVMKRFKHALSQTEEEKAEGIENFFQHEVEYILYGDFDDQQNAQHFLKDLLLLRSALNLIHIYSDHEKREQTLKAALAMTKGIGTAAIQFAIASAWSYAEALIDVEDIKNGKKSPFIKNRENWNLTFENILKGKLERDRNKNENIQDEEGLIQDINRMSYEDYLKLFLLPHRQEVTLYRALDVTQINMKTKHDREFDVRDYYTGCAVQIDFTVKPLFINATWMFEDIKNRKIDKKYFFVRQVHDYY